MKKILLATALLASVSCNKTEDEYITVCPAPSVIEGTWEMRMMECGWSGTTNLLPGNNNKLTLSGNGAFVSTGTLKDSGTYKISQWVNGQGQPKPLLELKGKEERKYELGLRNDTLTLDNYSTVADACGYTYKKVQ